MGQNRPPHQALHQAQNDGETLGDDLTQPKLETCFFGYTMTRSTTTVVISYVMFLCLRSCRGFRFEQVGILVAVVVAGMLWLLGIQMAYVFGIFTFVLHFIPNLGPLVATCLPMPLVIFDPGEANAIKSNGISLY